jgi:hypothetical protein
MGVQYQGLVVSQLSTRLRPYIHLRTSRASAPPEENLPPLPATPTGSQSSPGVSTPTGSQPSPDVSTPTPLHVTIPPESNGWCITYAPTRHEHPLEALTPLSPEPPTINDGSYGNTVIVSVHISTSLRCIRDEMIKFGINCVMVYDQDESVYVGLVDTRCVALSICRHGEAWVSRMACDWMHAVPYILSTDTLASVCRRTGRHFFARDTRCIVSQGDLLRAVQCHGCTPGDTCVPVATMTTPVLDVDAETTFRDVATVMTSDPCMAVQIRVGGEYYRLLTINDVCTPGVTSSSTILSVFPAKDAIVSRGDSLRCVITACIEHDVHQVMVGTLRITTATNALRLYSQLTSEQVTCQPSKLLSTCTTQRV